MIIGSGLIANAFGRAGAYFDDACLYAAGVSNSDCRDSLEFERERLMLSSALQQFSKARRFIYFGTCSVGDPSLADSMYVRHKMAMEDLVRSHSGYLIFRLPQVVGITRNPHTLLNFLHHKIAHAENFKLWMGAKRNVIDIADVVAIAMDLLEVENCAKETIDIANTKNFFVREIVEVLENILGLDAVYDRVEKGASYEIDVSRIGNSIERCNVSFDSAYLQRVCEKYYSKS
ncbi:NAD-dependent dehydratase [Herbaspirillum rhizosphaerae]|uniref:NAD-dependent dehydratase n=1 Tax=Herbaspirillum rhizosphaerae TaxID=346179 RepID=A0ABW8Z8B2_9BURK